MLKLEIVTPEKKVVEADADWVTIPTASGEVGIFPNHAPLISALKPGILEFAGRNTAQRIAVAGGFVEINHDKVTVLADSAETADEIDTTAARAELEAAQKAIAASATQPIEETEALREQVDSANARLQLAAGKYSQSPIQYKAAGTPDGFFTYLPTNASRTRLMKNSRSTVKRI